jgi:hypothetical protein
MQEFFPIVSGLILGAAALQISSARLRLAVLLAMSVVLGMIATTVSGEHLISWAFILIDIPLVLGAAVVAMMAVTVLQGRSITTLRP